MLFGTRYNFIGTQSPERVKERLTAFLEHGSTPGTIAHYVMGDGRGGLVITETDSIAETYNLLQNYTEWVEFETHPMLTIEEALPMLMNHYS